MTKKKKIILGLTAVAVLGVGGLALASTSGGSATGAAIAAVEATRQTLETSITAQGEVVLLSAGEVVSSPNALEVAQVLVAVNDVVVEGQPLVRFNANIQERNRQREQFNHQLNDTRLLLASQEVSLAAMRLGPTLLETENAQLNIARSEQGVRDAELAVDQLYNNIDLQERAVEMAHRDIEAANRGLELVLTSLLDAQTTYANTQTLFAVGATTQVQLDTARRSLESVENERFTADSRVASANTQLVNSQAQLQTLHSQLAQAQSNIATSQDSLQVARIQLADLQNRVNSPQNANAISQQEIAIQRTQLAIIDIERNLANLDDVEEFLFAPTSGTVTAVNTVAGNIVTPGAGLVTINNPEHYVVRAFVNERHASQLVLNQEALIEGSILAGEQLVGHVHHIASIATTSNIAGVNERVVHTEIAVADLDTQLLIPGVTLDVTITTDVREHVIAIPLMATLVDPQEGPFVFVVADDSLEQRFVHIVTYADMYVEVEGITEGEIVASQPLPNMYHGMVVSPVLAGTEYE